jgi:hypothetical protein
MSLKLLDNEKRKAIEERESRFETGRLVSVMVGLVFFLTLSFYMMPFVGQTYEIIMSFFPIHVFLAFAVSISLAVGYRFFKAIYEKENEIEIVFFHAERHFEALCYDIGRMKELAQKHELIKFVIEKTEQSITIKQSEISDIMRSK